MSIRFKIILVAIFAIALNAILVFYISSSILNKGVLKLEKEDAINDNNRFETIYTKSSLDNLSTKLADWSSWDDTYKFINDKNDEYIKSNLQNQSLVNLKLNFMVYVNSRDEIVYGKGFDFEKNEEIVLGSDFKNNLKSGSPILKHQNLEDSVVGLVVLDHGPLIFASRPILTSEAKGPSRGTLIFGRYFDRGEVAKISDLLDHSVTVINVDAKDVSGDFAKARDYLMHNGDTFVLPVSDDKIESFGVIKDIYGKRVVIFRLEHPRELFNKTLKSSRYFPLYVAISSLFFGAIVIFLIDRQIFRRIYNLQTKLRDIGKSGDLSFQFPVRHNDEISRLTASVNLLLKSIGESQKREFEVIHVVEAKSHQLEEKNSMLDDTKKAILNILEDSNEVGELLEIEKAGVEKKVEEKTHELSEEKDRLFKFLETIPEGVFVLDANGKPFYANSESKRLLGKGIVDTATSGLSQVYKAYIAGTDKLYPPEKIPIVEALSGRTTTVSDIEIKKDDITIPLEVSGAPIIDSKGKIVFAIATFKDITEEKILERSKDEFFSIASHELRTPLTSIRGNSSMIQDYFAKSIKDKDLKEMIDDIHESSIRLIGIVNDFLNVSRLEQNRMEFKKEKFDISLAIEDAAKETEGVATEKNLYVKFNKPSSKVEAIGDIDKVKEVIINLIGNGLKFTEKGGITIDLKTGKGFVEVNVTDTGIGLVKSQEVLLFRKFQQAQSNPLTRDTSKGTGLGLYISKMMVEAMGGKIGLIKSVVGRGTTFAFTLPIVQSQQIASKEVSTTDNKKA